MVTMENTTFNHQQLECHHEKYGFKQEANGRIKQEMQLGTHANRMGSSMSLFQGSHHGDSEVPWDGMEIMGKSWGNHGEI